MVTEVLVKLEHARRQGSPEGIGKAHLDVISTLVEMLEQTESPQQTGQLYGQMIEHVDKALKAYEGLGPAWRLAQVHLMKAAILTDMAEHGESAEDKHGQVGQAVFHCQQASNILFESEELRYLILADWHAMAASILLRLRLLVEDDEAQRALDGMIEAYSEILGESLAWDIEHQGEGNDLLFAARVLGVLAEGEDDSQERLEIVKSQLAGAVGASEYLRHTSDLDLAKEAYNLVEETSAQLSNLKVAIVDRSEELTCSSCDNLNAPGKKFCTRCGARLVRDLEPTVVTQSQGLTCASCGHVSAPSSNFCARCGVPQD